MKEIFNALIVLLLWNVTFLSCIFVVSFLMNLEFSDAEKLGMLLGSSFGFLLLAYAASLSKTK